MTNSENTKKLIREIKLQGMTNLENVKDFIRTANREELSEIRTVFNTALKLIQKEEKSQFKIGDRVTIVHESRDPKEVFVVERVNKKTISISGFESFKKFKVSPNLLKHA